CRVCRRRNPRLFPREIVARPPAVFLIARIRHEEQSLMATRLNLLLCPVGSLGDMHPMFAIADEARRRGHRITRLANEEFEKSAVDLDGEFVAVQDAETLRAMTDDPRSYTYATGYRRHLPVQCVEPMRRLYAALAERSGPADTVIVASNWAFGARIAS